jgi:hypothetical protein
VRRPDLYHGFFAAATTTFGPPLLPILWLLTSSCAWDYCRASNRLTVTLHQRLGDFVSPQAEQRMVFHVATSLK